MPRRRRRWLLFLFGGLALLVAGGVSATVGWRPFIGPRARGLEDHRFEATPARMARGRYLVRSVNGCLVCHSDVDTGRGVPTEAAMDGAGKIWAAEGMPWLVAPNLTADRETGVGEWADDMLARAIREGIGHDGRALFPIMPYQQYRHMSDEDLASVIVYLRSLPPVNRSLPMTEVPFPPGPLINALPAPLDDPVAPPDLDDQVSRGEYLVRMGACFDCHTPLNTRGEPIAGLEFSGGMVLQDSRGQVASGNITQHPSGIPYYDDELFLQTIRTGSVIARKLNDVMPWWVYRNMTDADVLAIYAYLRTLPPVGHRIDNEEPPTDCPICGLRHGGGETNQPAS